MLGFAYIDLAVQIFLLILHDFIPCFYSARQISANMYSFSILNIEKLAENKYLLIRTNFHTRSQISWI